MIHACDTPEEMERCLHCPYEQCEGRCNYMVTGRVKEQPLKAQRKSAGEHCTGGRYLKTRVFFRGRYRTAFAVAQRMKVPVHGLIYKLDNGLDIETAIEQLQKEVQDAEIRICKRGTVQQGQR